MNYDKEIDEWLDEWGAFLSHSCMSDSCPHYGHYREARQALIELVAKARVDELTIIRKRNIDYRVALYVDERIAELTKGIK